MADSFDTPKTTPLATGLDDLFSEPVLPVGAEWAQSDAHGLSPLSATIAMSLGQPLGMSLQGLFKAGTHDGGAVAVNNGKEGERSNVSQKAIAETAVLAETLGLLRAQTDGIAASAFDAYASAMESAVDSGHFSAAGIGKAMRASTKQSLLSIGQQAASKGAFEIAEAVGSAADGEGAGKHLAAAGKWFLVAGLAGAGAAAVGGGEDGGGSKDRKRDEVAPNGADSEGRDASKGRVIQHIRVVGNPTDAQVGEIKGRLASGARGRAH